ncbi:MAG: hypothetical protein WDO56_15475 [Gammaproteobacteria bacterium]
MYLCGLIIFTLGSAACAMSSSISALIGSRAVQGLGGSCMAAMGPACCARCFLKR